MAIMLPSGAVVAAINGTLDGYVYYRGRYGNTVRTWVNPTNTITPERTAVRTLFASLVSLFNSLTPDMQNDWDLFAQDQRRQNRLAQEYIPTGLQIFLERNMNLSMLGTGPLLLPIPDEPFDYIITADMAVCTPTLLQINLKWFSGGLSAVGPTGVILSTTNNQPAGTISKTNRYRATSIQIDATTYFSIISPYWDATWSPSLRTVGKRIFCKAVAINNITGQAAAPVFCSSLVS